MHNVKELEKQYNSAKQRAKTAHSNVGKAAEALYNARVIEIAKTLVARGIQLNSKVCVAGTVVVGFKGIIPATYDKSKPIPLFTRIKDNGTVSKAKICVNSFKTFDDIQPFREDTKVKTNTENQND